MGSILIIDEEIRARISAAKARDKDLKLEDFQIRAHENGLVLVNLKTRRIQLLFDEERDFHSWEQLRSSAISLH